MMSGFPMCHLSTSVNWRGGGISAELPCGAPASAHFAIVAISASVNDGSSLNFVMPTWRSMYHGGISRAATFALIDFAHGRASWYVNSGIGAMAPWRWQFWQDRWRIGAMSFVNVTLCADAFEDTAPSTRRVRAQGFMNAS